MGSSRTSRGTSRTKALANARRWRSPADSPAPPSPSTVGNTLGEAAHRDHQARSLERVSHLGCRKRRGGRCGTLSATVRANRWGRWGTQPIPAAPGVQVEVTQVHPAEPDVSRIRAAQPQDDVEQRRLATAAGSGECDDLTGLDGEVGTAQGGNPTAGIGDLEADDVDALVSLAAPCRLRRTSSTADVPAARRSARPLSSRRRWHGSWRRARAQRQVGLGRKDEHEEGGVELHGPHRAAAGRPPPRPGRPRRWRAARETRKEVKLEGGQGGHPITIGHVRDGRA